MDKTKALLILLLLAVFTPSYSMAADKTGSDRQKLSASWEKFKAAIASGNKEKVMPLVTFPIMDALPSPEDPGSGIEKEEFSENFQDIFDKATRQIIAKTPASQFKESKNEKTGTKEFTINLSSEVEEQESFVILKFCPDSTSYKLCALSTVD